nr:MAG TPA: hypothetical protein [Caudoviricetes sp.]
MSLCHMVSFRTSPETYPRCLARIPVLHSTTLRGGGFRGRGKIF